MASAAASVLAINGGSSSIKFAVYDAGTLPKPSVSGALDRIGRGGVTLSWRATPASSHTRREATRRAADLGIRIAARPEPVVVHEEFPARAGEVVENVDERVARHWQEADRSPRAQSPLSFGAGSLGGFDVEPLGLGLWHDRRGDGQQAVPILGLGRHHVDRLGEMHRAEHLAGHTLTLVDLVYIF